MSSGSELNGFVGTRIELAPRTSDLDVYAKRLHSDFLRENPDLAVGDFQIETAKVYHFFSKDGETNDGETTRSLLREILLNPVLDHEKPFPNWNPADRLSRVVERRYRPGMTDNAARTLEEAYSIRRGSSGSARAHRLDLIHIRAANEKLLARLEKFLSHPLLHLARTLTAKSWESRFNLEPIVSGESTSGMTLESSAHHPAPDVETFAIQKLGTDALIAVSKERLWALNLAEMHAIQTHYQSLDRDPTLGEMEVFAQTWSEHCKHKIFRGTIHYREPATLPSGYPKIKIPEVTRGLFHTAIKAATDASPKPWLLSVFSDNAGILAFTEEDAVCIKVETHNSPSAIDPFAGAITGIGGVHRDIIGTGYGAKPIFNLDVFCVAPARFDHDRPDGILPPSRILEGIRAGVEAGGNPAGIPTICGALVYDSSYLGKPLVFCGSGGLLPREIAAHPLVRCEKKEIIPGDLIVMVGGRVGRDGIHGATFSSLALDASDPSMANATVVQLGDPFTQKRALDFILKARDRGLFRTLTDNGAGGLSSSVGELATLCGGAELDLTHTPLKATDLRPEEILVSESQERMTVAVPAESLAAFLALSREMSVESTALGKFTASGRFDVLYRGATIASLDLEFLHEGCPKLEIQAEWKPAELKPMGAKTKSSLHDSLLALLGSENIASKESLIRQYDHEVQGCSLVKPQTQIGIHRSPNQSGAVLLRPDSNVAAVIGVGILPEYSRYDAYTMAQASLDEAVRNVLSSGAEYGTDESVLALLDNFCWPDPVSNPAYAADLVRAGYGLRDAAIALGLPFVSGKDSMKNDYRGKQNGKDIKISVLPTVLVTALGRMPDLARARSSEFKSDGDAVYLFGPGSFSLLGSQFERIGLFHLEKRELPLADWNLAKRLYSWLGSDKSKILRSCADVSEGGLLSALSEGLFAYGLGFSFDSEWFAKATTTDFFGEGFHSFVVSVTPIDESAVTEEWRMLGLPFTRLGNTTKSAQLKMGPLVLATSELESAWKGVAR